MTSDEREKIYLARAKEAEEQAAKAREATSREQWLKIAEAYRHLAKPH